MSPALRPLQPTASALHFFGAELRHWRGLRGLSQDQVAAGVLHGKDLICKIEKADRRPSRDLAKRLDDILDAGGALYRLYGLVEAEASGVHRIHAGDRRVAICGSRAYDTDPAVIDEAVRGLARLAMSMELDVRHGPVGTGIEVVAYAADHYQRGTYEGVVALLGRPNVVRDVDAVIVVGGGTGTRDEVDLATAAGVPVIPLAATGGAARRVYARMERDRPGRFWIGDDDFEALASCGEADAIAGLVGRLLLRCRGNRPSDRPYTLLSCAMSVNGYADDAAGARLLHDGGGYGDGDDEDFDRVDAVRASVDAILVDTAMLHRARARFGDAITVVDAGEPLSLDAMLSDLSDRGVRRLMIEGGGPAATRFLAEDLIDEIRLVVTPFFAGGGNVAGSSSPAGHGQPPRSVDGTNYPFSSTARMSLAGVEHFGDRVLLRYLHAPAALPATTATTATGRVPG